MKEKSGMATRRSDERMEEERPPPPRRPAPRRPELDDWLNARIFHPLAHRLAALLAATPVTPNMVSIAGGLLIVAAGFLYTGLSWPVSAALGFAAHALWHVLDGADGDLARLTGRASPTGELVDGVCDYAGHVVLYVLLAAFLAPWLGGWAWTLAALAGASRVVQANHAESQRRTYLWRVYGVPWLKQVYQSGEDGLKPGPVARLFEPLARLYVAGASLSTPLATRIDALVERASRTALGSERARRVCREESRVPLRLQTLLGANGRTLALGLSMALGSPFWFFLLEVSLLNLLLLLSILAQRRCDRRIVERLEANATLLGA
jgi:hypothetical protein